MRILRKLSPAQYIYNFGLLLNKMVSNYFDKSDERILKPSPIKPKLNYVCYY